MWYSVDWVTLVQQLLPHWMRQLRMIAWLRLLVGQVRYLHGLFLIWREGVVFDITHTGQTASLEHWLNARFDPVDQRITITNLAMSWTYMRRQSEAGAVPVAYPGWRSSVGYVANDRVSWGGAIWVATAASTGVTPAPGAAQWSNLQPASFLRSDATLWAMPDFVVDLPAALVIDQAALRQLVETYRPASRTYTITVT
jgi:hypothetical protein